MIEAFAMEKLLSFFSKKKKKKKKMLAHLSFEV